MSRFFIVQILITFLSFNLTFSATSQGLVINEVDAIQSEGNQFVELYGIPNTPLDGFSIVLVKALWLGGGAYEVVVYDVISLNGMQLDSDGFLLNYVGLNTTIAAVAIYEVDASLILNDQAPPTGDVIDAIVYGNTSVGNPQAAIILQALVPIGTGLIYEGAEANGPGHSISRLPDGGESFDISSYVLQAPSPGVTNILECDGGILVLTNLANDTVCTDQGPAITTFIHDTDALTASLTLFIVDPNNNQILSSALGSAVNFQGMGDGELSVVAVSHNAPLDATTTGIGMDVYNVTSEGCFSISEFPYLIMCVTCETPACDGGTMLDASGSDEVIACLTADGALVPFGYYSEAVEDDFLFAICTVDDIILATVAQPYFDFSSLGADDYHVWGISTQGVLDASSIAPGSFVQNVSANECDSVGASSLLVTILECGAAGLCEDLIISEYIEGESHNKAIEIHNPSPLIIDLSLYTVEIYNNGALNPLQSLSLEGELQPGDVFVIGNSQSVQALQNLADVFSQVTWYNGNDAIVLRKNGEAIDILGVIGEDPGEPWTVSTGGAMAEYTLVRKPNVGSGTTNWAEGSTQWDTYPQDTFDFLGSHTATCGGLGTMTIGFDATELYVSEGGGAYISISPTYPLEDAVLQVSIAGGDAVIGEDYPDVFPLTFNFDMGLLNSQTFTFSAIDEEVPELQEDVILALSVISGGVELGIDTLTIHILPSDLDYPVYEINQVRGTNPQGVLDSIGTACELRGIVHGWNDYPSGLQFTLIDPTNGINVFSPVSSFGYSVTEGDSVRVRGVIDQYLGLAQIRIDTLLFEGSGLETEIPLFVSEMDEETESRVVTLKCTELVDIADWTNTIPGFDVRLDFGFQEILMRIDANTNLFGQPAPVGVFGVTGIGGQRDDNSPYVDGYTITPRGQFDLTTPVNSDFIVASPWDGTSGPVEIFNMSTGAGDYIWSMGDGTTYNETAPSHSYLEAGTFQITLTAFSLDGNCSDQQSIEIVSTIVGIDKVSGFELNAFPNPTEGLLRIISDQTITSWQVLDYSGKAIMVNESQNAKAFSVDVNHLSAGYYTVQISTELGVGTLRFVKR